MSAVAERRATLPLTEPQRLALRCLRRRPLTTDQLAIACGTTRDGARAIGMALAAKGRVVRHSGRPTTWERT